ncbi:MAG TPA: hypothetical protein VFE72_04165 [Lysobacter sp.]|nr:hypothetical protein [Lysobacter sp.]
MTSRRDVRNEDGGYGGSSLVGSDEAGTRTAIESREAMRQVRDQAAHGDDAGTDGSDLGRLADGVASGDVHAASADAPAGVHSRAGSTVGTRAAAGQNDSDRDSRDGGNSLQR